MPSKAYGHLRDQFVIGQPGHFVPVLRCQRFRHAANYRGIHSDTFADSTKHPFQQIRVSRWDCLRRLLRGEVRVIRPPGRLLDGLHIHEPIGAKMIEVPPHGRRGYSQLRRQVLHAGVTPFNDVFQDSFTSPLHVPSVLRPAGFFYFLVAKVPIPLIGPSIG
jgi:hypothetical protein